MQLALQLYTVRKSGQQDMAATIEDVGAAGYSFVETAGYGNLDASSLRSSLDRANISAIASHVPYDRLKNEFSTVLTEMKILGCRHVVVPWIDPAMRNSEGVDELVGNLNRWARTLQEQDIRMGYHNHDFEFQPLGDSTMFERIATETDSALVDLELDLGWISIGGADPLALIKRFTGRVPLLHAKDFTSSGGSVTAGHGALPWKELIPAAIDAGCKYLIVENDEPEDASTDIRESLKTLSALVS